MGIIRQLPPAVINQIAAGEVVERASSVVKELLENAIDAQATRVDLSVERGGKDLVRVADNGVGMADDDLLLAFQPHATRSWPTPRICTECGRWAFGVRRWRRSRKSPRCAARAARWRPSTVRSSRSKAGIFGPVKECGCPAGTVIEVRNLFQNIPVRRAFLKSDMTEAGHVAEMFCRVALAHPAVHLTYRSGGKLVHDLPPVPGMRERIAVFFGRELAESLLWIEGRLDDLSLWGYVGHPSQSRSTAKGQFLFLGGRYVRDRSLGHALNEAYRGLLMVGRMPVAFLHLEIPPEQVDVNVHPTKVEVRFRDPQRVYSHLLSTLRQTFLKSDLHTRLQATQEAANAEALSAAGRRAGTMPPRASHPDWHSAEGRLSRAWACSIWLAIPMIGREWHRGSKPPGGKPGFPDSVGSASARAWAQSLPSGRRRTGRII